MIAALGLGDDARHVRGGGTPIHVPFLRGGSWIRAMLLLVIKVSFMRVFIEMALLWVLS
jgi:hypothetical protein